MKKYYVHSKSSGGDIDTLGMYATFDRACDAIEMLSYGHEDEGLKFYVSKGLDHATASSIRQGETEFCDKYGATITFGKCRNDGCPLRMICDKNHKYLIYNAKFKVVCTFDRDGKVSEYNTYYLTESEAREYITVRSEYYGFGIESGTVSEIKNESDGLTIRFKDNGTMKFTVVKIENPQNQ